MSRDRMPPLRAETLTEEQKKAAQAFEAQRGRPPFGPFVPLLRSPQVLLRVSALGEWLRYHSSLPSSLNEFLILLTARQWTQQYEWHHHLPHALKAGLDPAIIEAVAEGRRPKRLSEDEEIVYEFAMELFRNRSVSDGTYERVLKRFGEQGVIDMTCVCGYYSLLSMVMNVARTPLSDGAVPPLAPLPG